MRIAFVSTYPPSKGSLNEYAHHFVAHLRRKPEVDEVVLLADELPDGESYPEPNNAADQGASFRIQPSWRFGAMDNALRIRDAVRAVKPDVVLFNLQFATFADKRMPGAIGLLAPYLVQQQGIVTAVLLHNIMETVDLKKAGFGSNPVIEKLTRTFGTLFTRMILASDMVAVTIPKYVDILTKKYRAQHIMLAPHGAFEETPTPSFDPPPGPLQIMAFGKFGTYKRVEKLIEAFKLVQAECEQPVELVIAGSDSPNTPGYLEGTRQQYADVPNIRYTGYVAEEDVPRIFGDAAVVVFPYNSTTGSSGVLHQAGIYGRPVVMPNLGDLAELVEEEGYTGEFFTPEDPRSLADAMLRILADPEHRQKSGMRNYLAASGLPMSEVVDWYLLHFERLLAARSLAPAPVSS